MNPRILELDVKEPAARLDRYLAAHTAHSRSAVQRLIREGHVSVNGAPAKARDALRAGDWVRVALPSPPAALPVAERLPLDLLYGDEHLLVVVKPAGMVVHPAPGHASGTLVNALLAYRPDLRAADADPMRPGIVHRLDRDTSGLLVVAVTREAQAALQTQFASRTVKKTYLALLWGHLAPRVGAIEAPIGRDPNSRTRWAVVSEGRYAKTLYRVREVFSRAELIEADLLTGRTHQLRVHFRFIGHPVVGDELYGYRRQVIAAPRQLLHAWRLGFRHPVTGEHHTFEAPLPGDFEAVLGRLRGDAASEMRSA